MHRTLLYGAFGFLLFSGVMHFAVDVVHQYLRGARAAGTETTYYFGMHSAFALGQVAFGILAILLVNSGSDLLSRLPGQVLGFAVAAGWLAICLAYIEYIPPRVNVAIFIALLAGAAATS